MSPKLTFAPKAWQVLCHTLWNRKRRCSRNWRCSPNGALHLPTAGGFRICHRPRCGRAAAAQLLSIRQAKQALWEEEKLQLLQAHKWGLDRTDGNRVSPSRQPQPSQGQSLVCKGLRCKMPAECCLEWIALHSKRSILDRPSYNAQEDGYCTLSLQTLDLEYCVKCSRYHLPSVN